MSHRIFKKRLNTTKFCFKVVQKNVKKIWPAHTPLDCSFIYFFPNTAVVIKINSPLSARQVTMIPVHMQYKDSMVTVSIYRSDNRHRRTGLEILGADTNLPDTKILKNRVSLMLFPVFWCGFLCTEQVTNEKKILRILVKQNMNRKIARLLSKNCPSN